MAPFAEQLGFLSEYKIALDESQDQNVNCRSQQQHPGRFIFDVDFVGDNTIIKQRNYQKRQWMEVHRMAGYRLTPAVVLVNNRYLYVIGGCHEMCSVKTVSLLL